ACVRHVYLARMNVGAVQRVPEPRVVVAAHRAGEPATVGARQEADARVGRLGALAGRVQQDPCLGLAEAGAQVPARPPPRRAGRPWPRRGGAGGGGGGGAPGPAGESSLTRTPVMGPQVPAKGAPTISSGRASMISLSVTGPAPGNSTVLSPWARPSGPALFAHVHEPTQSSDHQSSGRPGSPRNLL